ncbi:hypothetical protein [Nevskia soli]|uniref:hypothetical protein n=1 Tax=Nevskia soli TaxID=418856 RepID=UPI0004A72483|nr:hypothetical protein [Nevskia soli]
MSDEQGDRDPGEKVVRLFPQQTGRGRDGLERGPALDWQDADALEREIQGVLGEARPAVGEAEARPGPDPAHRNAVRCPQCDRYTWRRTRYCQQCNADLPALAAERRRSWLWSIAIVSWGLGLGCIYLVQNYFLPAKARAALLAVVLIIAGFNVFGFWLATQYKAR